MYLGDTMKVSSSAGLERFLGMARRTRPHGAGEGVLFSQDLGCFGSFICSSTFNTLLRLVGLSGIFFRPQVMIWALAPSWGSDIIQPILV